MSLHYTQDVYPPTLLSPEVEYHIVTSDGSTGQQGDILNVLSSYLCWADAGCCSVSRETSRALYSHFERMRTKRFAQGILLHPLVCASSTCLTCSVETFLTHAAPKLVCRDEPVFDLREIVH